MNVRIFLSWSAKTIVTIIIQDRLLGGGGMILIIGLRPSDSDTELPIFRGADTELPILRGSDTELPILRGSDDSPWSVCVPADRLRFRLVWVEVLMVRGTDSPSIWIRLRRIGLDSVDGSTCSGFSAWSNLRNIEKIWMNNGNTARYHHHNHGDRGWILLPPKRMPDSSISSLIWAGWCQKRHPATKKSFQLSHE